MSDQNSKPGINIRSPWSRLIAEGRKTVETRSYEIPEQYLNNVLYIIETHDTSRRSSAPSKVARIIGMVKFTGCFKYQSKESWTADYHRHLVKENDENFGYATDRPKWGWIVGEAVLFPEDYPAPNPKGIKFTKACSVPIHT